VQQQTANMHKAHVSKAANALQLLQQAEDLYWETEEDSGEDVHSALETVRERLQYLQQQGK